MATPPILGASARGLRAGYALSIDLGQYRLVPVVPGQACSSRAPSNIAGRQWSWTSEQRRGMDGVGLAATTTTSTGLERTYGAARVDDRLVGVEVSGRSADSQALVASMLRAVTDELVSGGPPTAGGS